MYVKQADEPTRVAPSRKAGAKSVGGAARPRGNGGSRRQSRFPLVEIGRAAHTADALAGLERWKERHAEIAGYIEPADVLVDAMRGRFRTWTRIRVNLQHVPEALRPAQEPLDPDEDLSSV